MRSPEEPALDVAQDKAYWGSVTTAMTSKQNNGHKNVNYLLSYYNFMFVNLPMRYYDPAYLW